MKKFLQLLDEECLLGALTLIIISFIFCVCTCTLMFFVNNDILLCFLGLIVVSCLIAFFAGLIPILYELILRYLKKISREGIHERKKNNIN